MAYADYGAIVKKNGKVLNKNHEFYHEMKDIVGFEIDKIGDRAVKEFYFNFMGDEDLLVCMYKNILTIFNPKENKIVYDTWNIHDEWGNDCYRKIVDINGTKVDIKRLDDGYRYRVRMWHKGNLWEAIYGYGVAYKIDYWYGMKPKIKNYIENWIN
ncbi:hypothetical protein BFS06_14515 [Clostridium perfringens]|uniref:Uncharacterized protein n=1 Tax=Clostridium perfringens TaxID=1502 RepID=A0A140GRA5_CLOPF|nr:hypothetical protein [Clostridium perfringens]AMN31064.1 hypothetical protein JFP838_pA0148 [Clostridium perfringens]TBX14418.1 hypothetical protein BFS06_14515 [Clostridium perfringens]